MWIAPPSGLRRISAVTTVVGELRGQLAHARGRGALAAVHGEERLGHRDRDLRRLEADDRAVAANAPCIALVGDRCSLRAANYSAPAVGFAGWYGETAAAELATCMCELLVKSCRSSCLDPPTTGVPPSRNPVLVRVSGHRLPYDVRRVAEGRFSVASGIPLGIKTYYILCSSAESRLIIVVRAPSASAF